MLWFGFIDFDRFRFDFSINNSISIRFGFDFFNDLHTSVDLTGFVCGHVGTHSAAGLATHEAIPSTAAVVVGLNRDDVEWAKNRSNSVALWHGAEAAKLDSVTAHTNSIHCLMFSLAPCSRCPLSNVRTSPTLVNRPTCLRAYNTWGCK